MSTDRTMLGRTAEGKGLYSRRDLLNKIAGGEYRASSKPSLDRVRRIWPDEPNVGFVEERMAFRVDGALKVGGPTLKTYDLNNDGTTGLERETRIYYDDTYGKLRGSENAGAAIDVMNAVGAWSSEENIAAAAVMPWTAEIYGDSSTYSLASQVVSILRPGVYFIAFSVYGEAVAPGHLHLTLTIGSSTYDWREDGLPGSELYAHATVPYVQTTTTATPVVLTLTDGTSAGATGATKSLLTILKMR